MPAVCSNCANVFDGGTSCPRCGVPLDTPAPGVMPGWQQTFWGRALIGLVVSQGLFYGLKQLVTGALLAIQGGEAEALWESLSYVLVLQAIQLLAMFCGGVLAGGGQQGGVTTGAIIGLWNGILAVLLQQVPTDAISPIALYGLPVVHGFVGGLGGLIGVLIWQPLPTVLGPELAAPRKVAPRKEKPLLAGPIHWFRVVLGTGLAVAGTFYAGKLLDIIADMSSGKYGTVSDFQDTIITWQARALSVILGAAFAGAFTTNGLKQGLAVGILTAIILVGLQAGVKHPYWMELTLSIGIGSFCLSLVGGWFGGQMFPPVLDHRPRASAEI